MKSRKRDSKLISRIGSTILLVVVGGCGGGGPKDALKTVGVSGTVTYNGKPLTTGEVRFLPVDPAKCRVGIGKIQKNGQYVVSTVKAGDGLVIGDYKVTILSYKIDDKAPQKDRDAGIGTELAIPKKYTNQEQSGLKETIKISRTIDLKLTDG